MRRSIAFPVFSMVATVFAGGVVAQEPRTNIGTLTCTVAPRDARPPADAPAASPTGDVRRDMSCLFKPVAQGGGEIAYTGSILKVGPGGLPVGKVVMIWSVVGPRDTDHKPGALGQRFVGETGTVATAPPRLVGEEDRSYSLLTVTNSAIPQGATVTTVELKLKTVPA